MVMPIGARRRANNLLRRDAASRIRSPQHEGNVAGSGVALARRFDSATSFCSPLQMLDEIVRRLRTAPSPPEYTTSVLAASRKARRRQLMSRGTGITRPQVRHRDRCGFFGAGSLEPQATTSAALKPKTSQEMYFFFDLGPLSESAAPAPVRHVVRKAESCLIHARSNSRCAEGRRRPQATPSTLRSSGRPAAPEGTAGRSCGLESLRT